MQVEFFPKCVVFYKIESTFSDISEGWYHLIVFSSGGEDLLAEEDEAKDNFR